MADTTTVRNAVNDIITLATDDVGGVHYQVVKIDIGADGTSSLVKEHLTTIDWPHARVHAGYSFHAGAMNTLGLGATFVVHLVTPASVMEWHLTWGVRGTAELNIVMTEAPTISVGGNGTPVAVVNRNRRSATSPTLLVYHTPTTTAAGTQLETVHTGAGKTVVSERALAEWVLAENQHYLITITSEAAGNDVDWSLDWYEE